MMFLAVNRLLRRFTYFSKLVGAVSHRCSSNSGKLGKFTGAAMVGEVVVDVDNEDSCEVVGVADVCGEDGREVGSESFRKHGR